MKQLIRHATLILEREILENGAILIRDGRIDWLGKDELAPVADEVLDAKGAYVGPGFVDLHVHGSNTALASDPISAATYFLRHGTTTLLIALYTSYDLPFFLESFDRIRKAQLDGDVGSVIAGVYMEGPFTNPKYGANPEKNLWRGEICPQRYRPLVDGGSDLVKIWVVAPEREGILPFLEYAKKVNPSVHIFAGHTEAKKEEMDALRPLGLTGLTHIMDATGRIPQWEGTRGFGPDEYCLLDDTLFAELISDSSGAHVNPPLQRLILKVLGADRILLITDAAKGKRDSEEKEGPADLAFDSKGRLAGSRLTMDLALKNVVTHTKCSLPEAFRMASLNGARLLRMEKEIGSIAVGKRANLVFLDSDLALTRVLLHGKELSPL